MAARNAALTGGKRRSTVPELYRKAAKVLKQAEDRKQSVKNLIYSSGFRDIKPLYALVAESIKHKNTLNDLIAQTGLTNQHPPIDHHLAQVLITELLWGKGVLKPDNARPIKLILSVKNDLQHYSQGTNVNNVNELTPVKVPRYVRINTLKCTVQGAIRQFLSEGWKLVKVDQESSYEHYIETVQNLKEGQEFLVDFHLDYLLVFPPKTQFHDHELVSNGSALLQDKASCLSAVALTTETNGRILDACAAPGMKTSLLAALSPNAKSIVAVERDVRRSQLLRENLENCGASHVQVMRQDFLNLNPDDYSDVEYILMDPSCSGSGIVKRFEPTDKVDSPEETATRLKKLSALQCKLLEHASRFCGVQRIVYSTCSIHPEENEQVVQQTLEKIGTNFKLETALPSWSRRGIATYNVGPYCVRADAKLDLTNGFFIAAFVRC